MQFQLYEILASVEFSIFPKIILSRIHNKSWEESTISIIFFSTSFNQTELSKFVCFNNIIVVTDEI